MLIILSPAKTINRQSRVSQMKFSLPRQLEMAKPLVRLLKQKSTTELAALMKINPKLAQLNYERFQQWHTPFNNDNAYPAAFSYHGEVFNGLQIESFTEDDLSHSQKHLRILSGLYGVLRPLDLIQPYRLEMAAKLSIGESSNLYRYWKQKITKVLQSDLDAQGDNILINLASNEYFKSIDTKVLSANIITPVFKEIKREKPVIVTMYAKKARGLMARYILQNRIQTVDDLKLFDQEGYLYDDRLSGKHEMVFTRSIHSLT